MIQRRQSTKLKVKPIMQKRKRGGWRVAQSHPVLHYSTSAFTSHNVPSRQSIMPTAFEFGQTADPELEKVGEEDDVIEVVVEVVVVGVVVVAVVVVVEEAIMATGHDVSCWLLGVHPEMEPAQQ